ncbi:hypothetical protein GOODEAATRI_015495 [Goodea atripinnis]|uniref:Uncharacterized protein n=1 Tax=Goodea atripinnis TaxID=208336 RepID=A0ABV0PNU2_9TELE
METAIPEGLQPARPRGQDTGRHAIRSPKTHSRTPPAQNSGKVMRSRGAPPPPALPSQIPPHQSAAPYRKHKQRSKESQGYRALGSLSSPGPVVEKEQVRDLPSVLLYDGYWFLTLRLAPPTRDLPAAPSVSTASAHPTAVSRSFTVPPCVQCAQLTRLCL